MRDKRALICSPVLPEYDREAGSLRMFAFVDLFLRLGWSVTYVARRGEPRYERMLRQMGVDTRIGFECTDSLLAEKAYDLAMLVFWESGDLLIERIRRISPATRVIVDSVDLHFLRNARRELGLRTGGPTGRLDDQHGVEFIRELNAYAAADAVLTVSEKEADLVDDLTGQDGLAFVVPLLEELPPSPLDRSEREGILFLGNFQHAPNLSAVKFLVEKILPKVPAPVLARHPVSIVGNATDHRVVRAIAGAPHVNVVGWVPSVVPYLHRSLISVVPLLYGAGTKRKVLQALLTGLPTVTTSVGAEGLGLSDREHVLVADDSGTFARSLSRLVEDAELWGHLAIAGARHVRNMNSRAAVTRALLSAVTVVMAKETKGVLSAPPVDPYGAMVSRLRDVVEAHIPEESIVAVVTKGDAKLVELPRRDGRHFPSDSSGSYAGYHPRDSLAALEELERVIDAGARYFVLPSPYRWWLDHYSDLSTVLHSQYHTLVDDESCVIFELTPSESVENSEILACEESITLSIPAGCRLVSPLTVAPEVSDIIQGLKAPQGRVLVLGVYLADQDNNAEVVVNEMAASEKYLVEQRWIALGGVPTSPVLAAVTDRTVLKRTPKFALLNRLLAGVDLALYEYVLAVDDDIEVPQRFLDTFLGLQNHYGFSIAQPARSPDSYLDHPIVQQQPFVARQTRFVEIGPVTSFHRSAFQAVLPFDLRSPMGWGYENVWAAAAERSGITRGIIDAVPVRHSLRPPVAYYGWHEADEQRTALLAAQDHLSYDECTTVEAIARRSAPMLTAPVGRANGRKDISVVIPTRDRSLLLANALQSLTAQTLARDRFEVIVVNDGSSDGTTCVCAKYAEELNLRYLTIDPSGIAVAKNAGLFLASGDLVLFFDDDDIASPRLLEEHVAIHTVNPQPELAVLGFTDWAADLDVTPVMRYVTDIGCYLFSYIHLADGALLDYRSFWGGRTSCKRGFLVRYGVFDQRFAFGCEDVELAYRLSEHGFKVLYHAAAKSYMARAVDFSSFCERVERQGRSQHLFWQLHPTKEIAEYCRVEGAAERWREVEPFLADIVAEVGALEARVEVGLPPSGATSHLSALYRAAFDAFNVKGIVEAMNDSRISAPDEGT